jgi:catalase
MAVKFHLPTGGSTDIVCLTLPVFFVKNPDDFLEFLHAQRPDPETGKPDMDRVGAFVNEHPETQKALGFLMMSMSPAGFANCTFHGIHAFKFFAPDGTERFIRYRWIPDEGEATLTDTETRELGREYLQQELERRLNAAPFGYELRIQIGEDADDPNDPTTPWPEERESVSAGHLQVAEYAGIECNPMIFDPGNLVDGIEPSNDPILKARSPAYSVSFSRRSGHQPA